MRILYNCMIYTETPTRFGLLKKHLFSLQRNAILNSVKCHLNYWRILSKKRVFHSRTIQFRHCINCRRLYNCFSIIKWDWSIELGPRISDFIWYFIWLYDYIIYELYQRSSSLCLKRKHAWLCTNHKFIFISGYLP